MKIHISNTSSLLLYNSFCTDLTFYYNLPTLAITKSTKNRWQKSMTYGKKTKQDSPQNTGISLMLYSVHSSSCIFHLLQYIFMNMSKNLVLERLLDFMNTKTGSRDTVFKGKQKVINMLQYCLLLILFQDQKDIQLKYFWITNRKDGKMWEKQVCLMQSVEYYDSTMLSSNSITWPKRYWAKL